MDLRNIHNLYEIADDTYVYLDRSERLQKHIGFHLRNLSMLALLEPSRDSLDSLIYTISDSVIQERSDNLSYVSLNFEDMRGRLQQFESQFPVDETYESASHDVPELVKEVDWTPLWEYIKLSTTGPLTEDDPGLASFSDRERMKRRYTEAIEQLNESVKSPRENWEAFDIPDPDFKNLDEVNISIPQLLGDIKRVFDAREGAFKDSSLWSKSKHITETILTATIPFALIVTKEVPNVVPPEKPFTDLVDCDDKSLRLAMCGILHFSHGSFNLDPFSLARLQILNLRRKRT